MARLKNKRRRGYTRISSKHQVTIPASVLRENRLAAGDELKVEADGGRIVLSPAQSLRERRLAAIERGAGSLTGAYPPGYLEKLRSEWRAIDRVDEVTAERAAELHARFPRLRLPDALVVAHGEVVEAGAVLTTDRSWRRVSRRVEVLA